VMSERHLLFLVINDGDFKVGWLMEAKWPA